MAYQPKSYRKFLATSVSAAMLASAAAVVPADVQQADAAESFSDVSNDYWASESIQRLADQGIINGYPDGTYGPGEEINRGQVAELLVNAFDLDVDQDAESSFEDLNDESYYTPFAEAVNEAGYITGRENDTMFAAGMDLSREQMATILVRAFELEAKEDSDATVGDLDQAHESHQENIEILAQYDITSTEDGNFRPKETVTRAQFATFLDRALEVQEPLEIANISALTEDGHILEVEFTRPYTEDLEASDIRITESDSGERVGVDEVELSSNRTTAEITLYDNTSEGAAPEIERLQEYDIQIGDLETTWVRPGFEDEIRVTDVDPEDGTITAGGTTYNVTDEEFDYYQALGSEISVWFDQNDDIVDYEFEDEDVVEGAIEVNGDADEIEVLNGGDTYDIADEEDFNFYLNGESEDLEADTEYDYAKLYFDNSGDVEAVHAYNFEDSILADEVDDNYVLGYDADEVDLEDHLIVKNGEQISIDDIQHNDLVFFNEDAEENGIAVVTDETVTGEIDGVYQNSFDIDGENFSYDGAQYVNEDGEIENLDDDGAEMLQDSGEEVTAHFNWKGDLVIVSGGQEGELEEQFETSYTTDSIVAYNDVRGNERVELSVVDSDGNEHLYDFDITDLEEIVVDGEEYETGDDLPNDEDFEIDEFVIDPDNDLDEETSFSIVAHDDDDNPSDDIVEISDDRRLVGVDTNEDGDVVGLKFFSEDSSDFSETVETDDDFVEADNDSSYRIQNNTKVVNVDADEDEYPDADDVTIMDWDEVQDNGTNINDGTVYYDEDNYATHIVTSDLEVENTTDYSAVLTRVDVNTDDEIDRIEALVNGERETYDVNDLESGDLDFADFDDLEPGKSVVLEVNDDNDQVTDIKEADDGDVNRLESGEVTDIEVGNNRIEVDGTWYELESDAEVYDVTDDDADDYSVENLRDIEEGDSVELILAAGGSTFVDAVVRTDETDGGSGGSGDVETDGEVTYINGDGTTVDLNDEEQIELVDELGEDGLRNLADDDDITLFDEYRDELEGAEIDFETNAAGEAYSINSIVLEEADYSDDFIETLVQNFDGITIDGQGQAETTITGDGFEVTADNVTMSDLSSEGTVVIGDVDDFTAENTNFDDLTVSGGGSDSVVLSGVNVSGDFTVDSDSAVRVEFAGTTLQGTTVVNTDQNVEFDADSGSTFEQEIQNQGAGQLTLAGTVNAESGYSGDNIVVDENADESTQESFALDEINELDSENQSEALTSLNSFVTQFEDSELETDEKEIAAGYVPLNQPEGGYSTLAEVEERVEAGLTVRSAFESAVDAVSNNDSDLYQDVVVSVAEDLESIGVENFELYTTNPETEENITVQELAEKLRDLDDVENIESIVDEALSDQTSYTEITTAIGEAVAAAEVAEVADAITFDTISGDNDSADAVTTDLTLPENGTEADAELPDVDISWASNNEDVVETDGTVNQPASDAEDANVTLTATVGEEGEVTEDVEIDVTVSAQESAGTTGE
ncbi:S-layer homology domain-containing protein [Salibacterium aidingense]|uniref:S-layer homology domain-containing protein n=1 Tax=Salibacterium aidingense TaxID=384933 RepID=UPI00041395C1|nr:S-layer homology domain-containing protein [Salibacterium aidingense]